MHIPEIENAFPPGPAGEGIRKMKEAGKPYPEILHLLAFKPEMTKHLIGLSQAVMRAQSPLSPGQRELIAALVSRDNRCPF